MCVISYANCDETENEFIENRQSTDLRFRLWKTKHRRTEDKIDVQQCDVCAERIENSPGKLKMSTSHCRWSNEQTQRNSIYLNLC